MAEGDDDAELEGDEVQLGWLKITKVMAPQQPAGVDVVVTHSEQLPILEALGMLAAAQLIVWDINDDDESP